jgi:copper oxidase (laccase) domain-containing protein
MTFAIHCSTATDGSMKSTDKSYASVLPARQMFLETHDIKPEDTTLLQLVYETEDFCRYITLTDDNRGDGITRQATIVSDALVTTRPSHALFLPLADCIGAVLYDPDTSVLMVSHLGRHNVEQGGGSKSVQYLVKNHDVNPKNLKVWLSPAAGKDNYPLHAFDNRGLHEVATEQLITAGIVPGNIDTSPIDTTTDTTYFSHSEFLKGHRDTDGRFGVVAVMRD